MHDSIFVCIWVCVAKDQGEVAPAGKVVSSLHLYLWIVCVHVCAACFAHKDSIH